jgi:superfamily II DNA helicase RecQ
MNGKYRLAYMAPEKLPYFMESLVKFHSRVGISLIAIDEAHCVSGNHINTLH